jgi:hypothetical protein
LPVIDERKGIGRVTALVEQPTHTIPPDCMCTWTVSRPGPGKACVSRLTYANSLCVYRHAAMAQRAALAVVT